MGSHLTTLSTEDCSGPSPLKDLSFFYSIRTKWIEYFIAKLNENTLIDFKLSNSSTEMLQWKDYFHYLNEIKDFSTKDNEIKKRLTWHPATIGYLMELEQDVIEIDDPIPGPDDDYTEDEIDSDISDNEPSSSSDNEPENENESLGEISTKSGLAPPQNTANIKKQKFIPPKHWNSSIMNPIYFGYTSMTQKEYQETLGNNKIEIEKSEKRAVEKAMQSRLVALEEYETNITAKEKIRVTKLEEMEAAYEKERQRRDADLARNKKTLPEMAFKMYRVQWEKEYKAAEAAYEAEIATLRKIHVLKTNEDQALLKVKREDVEAFKNAENQEVPAAERLEEISKAEMSYWIDEVDIRTQQLEEARLEYQKLRLEFQKIQGNKKKQLEMKSALNVTETKVRTFQRKLEESIANLTDSETLLDRAIRIKEQQDKLLPLFQIISNQSRGRECRLDLILAAILILSSGTFDQKLTQLLRAYDPDQTGSFSFQFLVSIQMLFHETFYILNFVAYPPSRNEIINTTERILFSSLASSSSSSTNTSPATLATPTITSKTLSTYFLNQFELKQFLINSIGMSKQLCQLVGILPTERYSTYQRNQMSSVALQRQNLISLSTTQYRTHFSITQFKPLLAPEHIRQIHDFALNMGSVDPNRANYDKFIKKVKNVSDSEVVPLDTGHLMNIRYYSNQIRTNAAIKIQTIMRAYLQRREAEFEAKRQAFRQARKYALLEMKEKVLKEFKRREAFEGTAKMKWDAQVRMRQAKLRSSGTNLSRADVVMVLMEEAIGRATLEIETRFAALEKEQGLDPEKTVEEDVSEEKKNGEGGEGGGGGSGGHEDEDGEGIFKIFGLIKRQVMIDDLIVKEEVELETPRDEMEEGGGGGGGGGGDEESKTGSVTRDGKTDKSAGGSLISKEQMEEREQLKTRSQLMLLGAYQYDPLARGETINETLFRMEMSLTDPIPTHLWTRLKSIDKNLTDVKLTELLLELPSKRFILKYLQGLSQHSLESELKKHFKIVRNHEKIAITLLNILRSDEIFGLEMGYVCRLIEEIERSLRGYVTATYQTLHNEMEAMIEKRFQGTEGRISEIDLIQTELDRIRTHLSRYSNQNNEILKNILQLKQKSLHVNYSIAEMEKREFIVQNLLYERLGHPPQRVPIKESYRQDWMRRINTALQLPSPSSSSSASSSASPAQRREAMEIKFNEIRNICHEFLEFATIDAMTIIREHRHKPEFQSLSLLINEPVPGRSDHCGRGIHGRYLVYESHSILYHICLDYKGIFDGNDENAMKAGGLDRLGSLEYFKCQINKLNIPLMATIDYFGYRVVAIAKSPIEQIQFTDEGEIKRIKLDQQYGMRDNGDRFINKSKTLQSLLRQASYRLNLIEHSCKGLQDMTGSATYASSELKAYKGAGGGTGGGGGGGGGGSEEGGYYLQDFWRVFPPEDPEETPHLLQITRDQSVFWRQLRPEYVKRYKKPLSPDALCASTYQQTDQPEHSMEIKNATRSIIQNLIPQYADSLCHRDHHRPLADGYGIDFSMELHDLGINIRHLGLIRGLLWRKLPGIFHLYFNEQCLRTSIDLRAEISHGMTIRLDNLYFTVTETSRSKITANKIPIDRLYVGLSKRNQTAYGGYLNRTTRDCEGIRAVLLTEMTCRTMKNLIRGYLRLYATTENGISIDFKRQMICKFLNILTGSNPESNEILMNAVYHGIRSRFGSTAVAFSERYYLQHSLLPCIPFAVKRLQKMMGIQIASSSLTEFLEHYENFVFVPMDIINMQPIVRHNMPALAYSDAMLVSMYATEQEKNSYREQVLLDKPVLFFPLSERNGTRIAENKGTLGPDYHAKYSSGCEFEMKGPIATDPYIRGIGFSPHSKSRVETRYHSSAVPKTNASQFSLEVFAKVTDGDGYNRVVCMNGRFAIIANRENYWTFLVRDSGLYEVSVRIAPVVKDRWVHLVGTYDGMNLSCYLDSVLMIQVEIGEPLRQKREEYLIEFDRKKQELEETERNEREAIKEISKKRSEDFFATKIGIDTMKEQAKQLLLSVEFQAEAFGESSASNADMAINMKKAEALRRVKLRYVTEMYVKAVQQLVEKFKARYDALEDTQRRELEESLENSKKPLRIGASVTTLASKIGKSYFNGQISCVSVFDYCLSYDRIRVHYNTSLENANKDSPRLHNLSSRLYEEALMFSGDDPMLMKNYAQSLCHHLRIENTATTEFIIQTGINKIKSAINDFKSRLVPLGIAEILMSIPVEYRFAELICHGFLAIKAIDSQFFSRNEGMTRKDLVTIPFKFGLDLPDSSEIFIETAGLIYREVVRDYECSECYGDVNMSWIGEIQSHHLVVALVSQLSQESEIRTMKISQLYQKFPREIYTLHDEDIQVMCSNMRLLVVVDLTQCTRITDISLKALATLKSLRILILDGCEHISDDGMEELIPLKECLEVLSLSNCQTITDEGVGYIGQHCRLLTTFNASYCSQVTDVGILEIAKGCKKLVNLQISTISLDDMGLARIGTHLSRRYFDTLDISFCRDISDHGIIPLIEQCPNITHLNLCGLHRITDTGISFILSNCLKIKDLNVEDIFLLSNSCFEYNSEHHPILVNELLLSSLQSLNLKDCIHITDQVIQALQKRCNQLETLTLQGCYLLTDSSLDCLSQPLLDSVNSLTPLASHLQSLNISSCVNFTFQGLSSLLTSCSHLITLNLSNIISVNDSLVQHLSTTCIKIQFLYLSRCIAITDLSLCSIGSNLWIEELDISNCNKITDTGMEIISLTCTGLKELNCSKLNKITNKSINLLIKNCKQLKELNIETCERVELKELNEFLKGDEMMMQVRLTHQEKEKEREKEKRKKKEEEGGQGQGGQGVGKSKGKG